MHACSVVLVEETVKVKLCSVFDCARTGSMFTGTKEVKGRMHTYYQVLLDTRDMPHIVSLCVTRFMFHIMSAHNGLSDYRMISCKCCMC